MSVNPTPTFLLLARADQNPVSVGASLSNIRNMIPLLELFNSDEFIPPKHIFITDKSSELMAELLRNKFVDIFQQEIRIPSTPKTEVSLETFTKRIQNANSDFVIAVSSYPLEVILEIVSPKLILPDRESSLYFCNLHSSEIVEQLSEKAEI